MKHQWMRHRAINKLVPHPPPWNDSLAVKLDIAAIVQKIHALIPSH